MSETMRAIIWQGPGRVALGRRPVPRPGPGQAFIEVRYNGLCATDYPIVEGQVQGSFPGMILGHEPVGPVLEVGAGVTGMSVGQRVVLDTMLACGTCRACRWGHPELCAHSDEIGFSVDGNWTDWAVLPAVKLKPIPEALGDLEATMVEALTCQMGGVEALDVRYGETAAIIGSGWSAHAVIKLLRLKGAGHVAVAMRPYPERLALARRYGAGCVEGTPDALRGHPQVQADEGFDVTIDAVGTPESARAAIGLARRGGRVLLYGLRSAKMDDFPLGETIFRNLTLYGRTSAPWMWEPAIDLVARGAVELRSMVGEVIDLDDLPAHLNSPRQPGGPLKRVVRVRGGSPHVHSAEEEANYHGA